MVHRLPPPGETRPWEWMVPGSSSFACFFPQGGHDSTLKLKTVRKRYTLNQLHPAGSILFRPLPILLAVPFNSRWTALECRGEGYDKTDRRELNGLPKRIAGERNIQHPAVKNLFTVYLLPAGRALLFFNSIFTQNTATGCRMFRDLPFAIAATVQSSNLNTGRRNTGLKQKPNLPDFTLQQSNKL